MEECDKIKYYRRKQWTDRDGLKNKKKKTEMTMGIDNLDNLDTEQDKNAEQDKEIEKIKELDTSSINSHWGYIQYSNGKFMGEERVKDIRSLMHVIWTGMFLAPDSSVRGNIPAFWNCLMPMVYRNHLINELEKAFSELTLCASHWKVHQLALFTYPSWLKGRKELLSIKTEPQNVKMEDIGARNDVQASSAVSGKGKRCAEEDIDTCPSKKGSAAGAPTTNPVGSMRETSWTTLKVPQLSRCLRIKTRSLFYHWKHSRAVRILSRVQFWMARGRLAHLWKTRECTQCHRSGNGDSMYSLPSSSDNTPTMPGNNISSSGDSDSDSSGSSGDNSGSGFDGGSGVSISGGLTEKSGTKSVKLQPLAKKTQAKKNSKLYNSGTHITARGFAGQEYMEKNPTATKEEFETWFKALGDSIKTYNDLFKVAKVKEKEN
ncbi:hypothetical protein NM688_g1596 [Phlebia brevispora]|uniref:Uncharacterized protein n=1 Tax=Phlebia brevispora TaxID=194682 RepID=A0ACC1TB00_9APHY|nr:hypothetical protein NM688_g1596 [Phlebia brevispora]